MAELSDEQSAGRGGGDAGGATPAVTVAHGELPSCCPPARQVTCCEPDAKAECCGDVERPAGACGC